MMMKKLLLIASILIFYSCNYKYLGCVICDTRTKTKIERYPDSITTKQKTTTTYKSMRAVDVPYKRKTTVLTYDPQGKRIEKTITRKVGSVWNIHYGYYKRRTVIDSGDYRIKEKFYAFKGVTVKETRKVKRKHRIREEEYKSGR